MAQKRMFDKAIIDTDKFMDLPVSAKALYFLLGMEADDEGFVSYKKVLRIHGGSEDDVKILVAKNFLISFPSGVVVITDWNTNNWLDSRRIKETEYQNEKRLIVLTDNNKYVLSSCLASIEENRVEENRVEEREYSKNENQPELEFNILTPKEIAFNFFNNEQDRNDKIALLINKYSLQAEFVTKEINKFVNYWTELNGTGRKQRWQMEKTFEVDRRLSTWFLKSNSFKNKSNVTVI